MSTRILALFLGTAMECLASMQSFLRGRPTHFRSIEHAIEWWYVYNYVMVRFVFRYSTKNINNIDMYSPRQEQDKNDYVLT